MRTTVDVEEGVLRVAKDLARERNETLGRVVSDLIRLGLQPARNVGRPNGIPTLARKSGAQLVTAQAVRDLLETEN